MQRYTTVPRKHALRVAGSFASCVLRQPEQVARFLLQSARYLGVSLEKCRGDHLAARGKLCTGR